MGWSPIRKQFTCPTPEAEKPEFAGNACFLPAVGGNIGKSASRRYKEVVKEQSL
jgi:hypothetical protein